MQRFLLRAWYLFYLRPWKSNGIIFLSLAANLLKFRALSEEDIKRTISWSFIEIISESKYWA